MEPIFFTEHITVRNNLNLKNSYEYRDFFEVRNGLITFKMCGFTVIDDHFITVLPKGVLDKRDVLSDEEKAKILLKVLMKYDKNAVKKDNLQYGTNRENESQNLFSSILEIIRDFKQHGIITKHFLKRETNGSGKIRWAKTFKLTTPYEVNGELIYLDLSTEKKLKNLSEEITMIHWLILKEIEYCFGWLVDFKVQSPALQFKKLNTIKAKAILKRAMGLTFNKHEFSRYKLLYDYVSKDYLKRSKNNSDKKLLYAFKFDMVWEEMCKKVFAHQEKLMEEVPKYRWMIREEREEYRYQIPDILIEDFDRNLFIVDAKYYSFNIDGTNSLPGGPDMGKQLLYLQSLESVKKFNKLYNIFVVPASIQNEVMTHYATGYLDNKVLKERFDCIYTLQLDCITAMQDYLKGKSILKDELLNVVKSI
ncbi:LlaJI family restriction endonuclease [Psychrobacillus soli]|uniref:LlaJI family restriction endonuclease n=1 Tax=Psychrobacillus soli TaxID=1543965 RepID=A0A544T2H9_9BACI|nr:LlaJI family restriction endonuclease [Psychrobacillus soli]TQR11648.1 LlaJI family restriction endonuclease [Psychrobacillus soli]